MADPYKSYGGGNYGTSYGTGESSSSSFSSQEPAYPEFAQQAGATVQDAIASAKAAKDAQLARLNNYVQYLQRLKALAQMAAKGAAARGATGQQNPLAVFRAMTDLANQAGIPIDAEIAKQLMQGTSIENTLNDLLLKASQVQTSLASISKAQSGSQSQSQRGGAMMGRIGGQQTGGRLPGVGMEETDAARKEWARTHGSGKFGQQEQVEQQQEPQDFTSEGYNFNPLGLTEPPPSQGSMDFGYNFNPLSIQSQAKNVFPSNAFDNLFGFNTFMANLNIPGEQGFAGGGEPMAQNENPAPESMGAYTRTAGSPWQELPTSSPGWQPGEEGLFTKTAGSAWEPVETYNPDVDNFASIAREEDFG